MSLDQHITEPSHRYDEGGQKLWSIYVDEAGQYDRVLIDTWKVSLDSTLIFSGLFSATITAFIVESYKLLKPGAQASDPTIALLAEILAVQRAIAFHNTTITSAVPPAPMDFVAPAWAIIVNILWFLSLTGVLVAAIIVTLVQQWVRDYVHRVHRYPQPLKRARMRLFLFSGIEKWKLDDVIHHIPTLLHVSLLLFFVGLCVFLAKINKPVVASVGFVFLFWLLVYCIATVAPLLDFAAPFKTPLSSGVLYFSSFIGGHQRKEKHVNLSALRERQAMRPFDADAAKVDAQAISWTIQRSTDDGEREDFLACIPGFLGSTDGRKTWVELLNQPKVVNMFLRGTADLLDVVSLSHGRQIDSHEFKRVTICLDALFAFLRTIPHSWPSTIDISPLSKPLGRLAHASCNDDVAIKARANCLFAFHKYLAVPPEPSSPGDFRSRTRMSLSLEADRGLQQVDTMRQNLEDALEEYKQGRTDKECISESLRAHLHAIDRSSQGIVAWLRHSYAKDKAVEDVLGNWSSYFIQVATFLQTPDREEVLLSIYLRDVPHLEDSSWSVIALVIMGYMRHTNVYPLLPDLPQPQHDSSTNTREFWFPFLKEADGRWISEPFNRELDPLAYALNILIQDEEIPVHVRYTPSLDHYSMRDIFRYPDTPESNLPTMGRPFSLSAAIVYETRNSFATRGLFELASVLQDADYNEHKAQTINTVTGPLIGETLRILGEKFDVDRSSGPLFSFSVLQKILTWERKRRGFPFSEDNMDYIVNTIFRSTLEQHDLVTSLDADHADMIGSLKEIDSRTIPFYDLRDLYNEAGAAGTGPHAMLRDGTSMTSTDIYRAPKFLEEGNYRPMKEKNEICSRIMKGRRRCQEERMRT